MAVFNLNFCCFITIFEVSLPRVPANSVTVSNSLSWAGRSLLP